MLNLIAKNWWLILLRGICAILFGLFALTRPGITLSALIMLWAIYAFVDGVLAFVAALSGSSGRPCSKARRLWGWRRGWPSPPGVTAIVLLFFIAARGIVAGILNAAAIQLRRDRGELALPRLRRFALRSRAYGKTRGRRAGRGVDDRTLRHPVWRAARRAGLPGQDAGRARAPAALTSLNLCASCSRSSPPEVRFGCGASVRTA